MWPFGKPVQAISRRPRRDLDSGIRNEPEMASPQRWTTVLVVYLRALAIVCLARGLLAWGDVLGVMQTDLFEHAPLPLQATTLFFAVLNCVAAVGIWLTSAWGAVVWLTISVVELLLPIIFPIIFPTATFFAPISVTLIAVYFVLTWLSSRERRDIE